MVQSLPEDRFIIVYSPRGLVSTVIWAFYILGLTVYIKNGPDGDVSFGPMGSPQVIIKWSFSTTKPIDPNESCAIQRTVSLFDADMQVLLRTELNDEHDAKIEGQEWSHSKGYGTTALRRWFNRRTFVARDDPVFAETANFAISFAIILSKVFRWVGLTQELREREERLDISRQYYSSTENWRLFNSSSWLFWGIKFDKRRIDKHFENLVENVLKTWLYLRTSNVIFWGPKGMNIKGREQPSSGISNDWPRGSCHSHISSTSNHVPTFPYVLTSRYLART